MKEKRENKCKEKEIYLNMGSEKMDRLKLVKPSKEQEREAIDYIE